MFAWGKVVISRCKYAGQDHVGSTKEQEIFQPETALPLYGMELLEPRVMLSGTGLLSAPQLIDALPSRSMVAITGFDTSGGISTEGHVVRAGDRSAFDIVIEEDEMSGSKDHWKYVLNEAVLGRSDVDNALKGISVVVDDDDFLVWQNYFPFPAVLASLEEPSHGQEIEQSSVPAVQLNYVTTDEMAVGTHRPEVLLSEDGKEIILVVVHPKILEDGTLVKHQVHFFDAETGQKSRASFDITWETEEYGEPADHRALLFDGELVVVYQSLVFDPGSSPGAGPAEQYALNQSLMLVRYSIEGEELFRGPIVAHVTDFGEDNFPDHCLVPLGNSLLVSTGSTDQIKFREVSYEGEVLNTYEVSTAQISSDFDGDGDVDGDDFLVWQNNFPTLGGTTSRSHGDADDNGNVDGNDFLVWQNHFPILAGSHSSEIRSLSSIGNSLLRVGEQVLMFVESRKFPGGESGISVLELNSEYQPTELTWLSQNGQERTFPTGNLHYDGYTFVTYDARDAQDNPVGPEDVPFYPRLMILDETLNVVVDMEIGTGDGFAHVHPTLTMVDGDLIIGWSMQAEGYDHRVPQVQLERYTLVFLSDDVTH